VKSIFQFVTKRYVRIPANVSKDLAFHSSVVVVKVKNSNEIHYFFIFS